MSEIIRHVIITKPTVLTDLGNLLFEKIADSRIEPADCVAYLSKLLPTKSIIWDNLALIFSTVRFEETPLELDYVSDIDYLGYVGKKAFGIQLSQSNFGNYSPSERMKASFADFEVDFGGKVFIVFSLDGEIGNKTVIDDIRAEIERLSTLT